MKPLLAFLFIPALLAACASGPQDGGPSSRQYQAAGSPGPQLTTGSGVPVQTGFGTPIFVGPMFYGFGIIYHDHDR